ncbi:MAG: amino acid adenylation domain-containing protein [Anaeromyxobacteraceae bacterium]
MPPDLLPRLARIWAEVLEQESVGGGDDFFELGGTSVKVMDMLSRVRAEFGVALGIQDLFHAPVLDAFAGALARAQAAPDPGRPAGVGPSPRRNEYPLSASQSRLWFLEQRYPGLPAYRTVTGISLRGALRQDALQSALDGVLARHPCLQAAFESRDGVPVQVIRPARSVPVPLLDLTALPEGEREIQRVAREELRAPLDLETDPMVRAVLVRLAADRHVLLLTIHHIVFDAWSRNVLVRDLAALYRRHREGSASGPTPGPLRFDFLDFAVWQGSAEYAARLDVERAYWKQHLGNDPLPFEFPLDRPRPPSPGFEASRETLRVPPDLASRLQELAKSSGTTLATVLLAAVQAVLHRHTESDSIVLGLVVAGRNHEGTAPLVGLFVNELAVRVDVGPGDGFRALLARTHGAVRGALAHQDLPLDEQVRAVRPARQIDQSPAFHVAYNFKPRREARYDFGPGLDATTVDIDPGVAPFDLMVDVERTGDAMAVHLDYDRQLFLPSTMQRLASHLGTLLQGVLADPDRPVSQLPLASPTERDMVLRAAAGRWPGEAAPDLVEQIQAQACRRPAHVAVEARDGCLTYSDLEATTNRLARRLRVLGVGRESRVGVAVPRGARELCALLATLKAGGAYVPVDPGHPVERVRVILEDAAPEVLIAPSDSPLLGAIPPGTKHLPLDDLAAGTAGFADAPMDEPVAPGQLAYILFTSGSTGRPKGVEVLRSGFANFLRSMALEPGLREDDRFLAITTTTFDISGLELFGPLWVGATAVVVDRQTSMDPRLLASALGRERVNIMQATPATWRMLVDAGWSGTRGLRMYCGGEPLSRDLANRLLALGSELWNLYGPTETTVWSTIERINADGARISIGRPIDRTRVYALDPAGGLVPPGVVGELFIGGDGVARGYRGRPDLTAERFLPDPYGPPGERFYRTGDLGRLLEDGRFECLGRTDHQVKVRGFRIELGEIESTLRTVPGVREVVVVAERQGSSDPRLVAYWIGEATREDLYARAREALAPYMVPSAYARLEAFPLTTSGKVDRKALPRADDVAVENAAPVAIERPRNDTEARIATVWASVLRIDSMGIDQDFFALGGTSLLAVQARSLLEREFGLEIPLRAFFESPTIRSIAGQIGSAVDPDEPIVAWLSRKPAGVPPVFCLLGVQLYQDVAEALLGVQPVVGIHVPTRYRPGDSTSIDIEGIARTYVDAIRAIQPDGPYHLAGFCFGGVVAYEVARQFEATGETVAQVAIFDGGLPGGYRTRLPSRAKEIAREALHAWRRFRGRPLSVADPAQPSGTDLVDLDVTSPDLRSAGRRYERTLGRIRARLLVFRALDRPPGARIPVGPDLGWSRFAERVSVCDIPSNHLELVRPPHSATVASRWSADLRR